MPAKNPPSALKSALIFGAGNGLSAALARRFTQEGLNVGLVARQPDKLAALAQSVNALSLKGDVSEPDDVARVFAEFDAQHGVPDIVVFNPSYRVRGSIADIDPAEVRTSIAISAFGGFLVGQQAAKRMLRTGYGTILFTGASASVKGYAQSASFAMGKFALRGLAQSMARELAPKNIHVAHFVIDGGIRNETRGRAESAEAPDGLLDPAAIADSYWHVARQQRSAWTWELELRPWTEKF
jgi:NAD(P)-dependent dehydrogenase (short-subunit alcohol dehydrogenase family)